MELSVLKAKVERNNLIRNAGKYYVDETSEIIILLNAQGKSALLGIQNEKGVYTIIGEKFVYYFTSTGVSGEIPLKAFIDELSHNANLIGKGYLKFKFMYKNIILSNTDKVWLYNSKTMFSFWDTILWLRKLPEQR